MRKCKENKYSESILNYFHKKLVLPYNQEMVVLDEEIRGLNRIFEKKKLDARLLIIDYSIKKFLEKYDK